MNIDLKITVYNELGKADSYGEARRMHMQDFNERNMKVLATAYAGINTSEVNFGHPLFYMTNDFVGD